MEKITYYDDTIGDVLGPKLVKEARMLEVEYLTRMNIYDVVSRKAMKQSWKGKLIKGRWLDVNKGDSRSPDSQAVARVCGKTLGLDRLPSRTIEPVRLL